MQKIKCAVIGLGWFGQYHLNVLQQIPSVEVSAICTRTESRLDELGKKYGIKKCYTDYMELLKDPSIEMVSITTHVKDHLTITLDAVKAQKHVFLEMPMADNAKECDQIIKALKNSNKVFMVGHICRFDTKYALAKERIENGDIGKILSIHAKRNFTASSSKAHLEKFSAIFGTGTFDFDLMLWYSDSPLHSVYAQCTKTNPDLAYYDIAWALFRFKNGAFGIIESNWALPDNSPYDIYAKMEIVGSKGMVDIDNTGRDLMMITEKGVHFPETQYWPLIHQSRNGYLKDELSYFIGCILHGKKPKVIQPDEARDAVYAIRMAEKSSIENKVIYF